MKLTEKLKELLGDEVFETIREKVTDLDSVFSDEDHSGKIPKERLDKEILKRKGLETTIEELTKSAGTAEEKQKIIDELNGKIETFEAEKVAETRNSVLEGKFKEFGVKDSEYVKFKLGELAWNDDNTVTGLDEKIKELKADESMKGFFESTESAGFEKNENKNQNNQNNGKTIITSEDDILRMSDAELESNMEAIDNFYSKQ